MGGSTPVRGPSLAYCLNLLGGGALVVEGEEAGEDFFFGEVGGPTVGGEDCLVEGAVSVGEPLGTLVVEVGEGALGKVARVDVWAFRPNCALCGLQIYIPGVGSRGGRSGG